MAISEALNWALNNGMTQQEFDQRIFNAVLAAQQPGSGVTDAMLRSEMDRLGISPEDVARATGVSTQSVQSRYTAAIPKTEVVPAIAGSSRNQEVMPTSIHSSPIAITFTTHQQSNLQVAACWN